MSTSTQVAHSNLNAPRSPLSISTDSSRRGSLRHGLSEKHPEPSTPSSPQMRLTRKRAASLNTDSANDPRIGDLALNSASTTGFPSSLTTTEQVCRCQPDPKIPRPRNAFILYRQHYQAQVVAQNPGLANPEISKIIGEQWREQAPEVKSDWKRLAEEEKQRHQRQYPGYRYQPRRAGKLIGLRQISSSLADDPIRCPKCNGRYMSTPSTPSTPFTPAFGAAARTDRVLPPFTHTTELEKPQYLAQLRSTRMNTPRHMPTHQQPYGRPQYPPPPLQTHHEREEDMVISSPSPGLKRRRFNEESQRGYTGGSPVSYSAPQSFSRAPPMASPYRQLPGPGMIVRNGSMGPPLSHSPINQQPRHQHSTRASAYDESLRLPPLQTQMSASTPTPQRPDSRMEARETQSRSVEAMVMTIPYISKIKVLTKIAPPLAPPGPTSPAQEIRGAVVVVEGSDKALLAEIGAFIAQYLSKDPSFAVTTWDPSPPAAKAVPAEGADLEMAGVAASVEAGDRNPFVDYLSIVLEWHKKSLEMAKYITSTPPTPPATTDPASTPKTKTLPIALVPKGYSLSTSDSFALRIPINDSYAPVDHWQWMATLWRGIVGPDLTVYVCRASREELAKYSGVEIRNDCPCIVVRIPEGGGKMEEKTARRLGFEVVEFVRNIETRFGRAQT